MDAQEYFDMLDRKDKIIKSQINNAHHVEKNPKITYLDFICLKITGLKNKRRANYQPKPTL